MRGERAGGLSGRGRRSAPKAREKGPPDSLSTRTGRGPIIFAARRAKKPARNLLEEEEEGNGEGQRKKRRFTALGQPNPLSGRAPPIS